MCYLFLMMLSCFYHEQQPADSLLFNIHSKPDSIQAALYIEAAKQAFGEPRLADSLGTLAFQAGKRANNLDQTGEGAFIVCYANFEVDYPKSKQWADTALYYFNKGENYTWAGYVTRNIGLRANQINKADEGIAYLFDALSYFEKAADTIMVAHSLSSISLTYHNFLFDYKKGIEYGLRALTTLESTGKADNNARWTIQNTIAINYDDDGQHEEALRYHFKNVACAPSEKRLASTYNNIGNSSQKLGRFTEAEKYFLKGVSLTKKADNDNREYSLATVYNNLSHVSWELKKRKLAEAYRDSAIYYSHQSKNTEKLMDTYYDSYLMCEKNRDFENASRFLKTYLTIKDSVFTAQKTKTVYELEQKYEASKKQQQIAALESAAAINDLELKRSRTITMTVVIGFAMAAALIFLLYKRAKYRQRIAHIRETEELQRQRFTAVLEAEENERSRVAKDLHDGIGQLLSIAKLTLSAVETDREENVRLVNNSMHVLDQATREVRTISHNMMPAALTDIGLLAALEDLFSKVNDSKLLHIRLEADGLDQRLPASVEIAVYRVIQEVINNMIKHSKADTITVQIGKRGTAVSLQISDNGVGFEKELISKSKGLGWKSIFSRISMLNGEIEVDTQPGEGTNVSIQFAI